MNRPALALSIALASLLGCGGSGVSQAGAIPAKDGQGVVLCFAKRLSVWVQVRATPASRAEGWGTGVPSPILVAYPARGFNPVFTRNDGAVIAWIDGERIVQTIRVNPETDHHSPIQEVTAALVVPPGWDMALTAGDSIRFVGAQ